MRSYLGSLEAKIGELGYKHDLFIMQSNGGVMTSTVAKERPVFTINSGLVGGVIGTKNLADILGYANAIGTNPYFQPSKSDPHHQPAKGGQAPRSPFA